MLYFHVTSINLDPVHVFLKVGWSGSAGKGACYQTLIPKIHKVEGENQIS